MSPSPAGIPPGGFKELGPVNWVIAKVGARGIRRPRDRLAAPQFWVAHATAFTAENGIHHVKLAE